MKKLSLLLLNFLCASAFAANSPIIWGTPYPLNLGLGLTLKTDSATTCNSIAAGSIRYNAGTFEGCNGTTWTALSGGGGGGTPGGASGDVQYNNAGSFAGDTGQFTWDATNHWLGIGVVPTVPFHLKATVGGYTANFSNTVGGAIIGLEASGASPTVILGAQSGTSVVGTQTADPFFLRTGGTNVVGISTAGYMGLGTAVSSPSSMIDVRQTAPAPGNGEVGHFAVSDAAGVAGNAYLTVQGHSTQTFFGVDEDPAAFFGTSTGVSLKLKTTNLDRITINSAGAVRFNTYAAGTMQTDGSGNITSTSFTTGSVPFGSSGVLTQDNSTFFWNNTSKRLGIGVSPTYTVDIVPSAGDVSGRGVNLFNASIGTYYYAQGNGLTGALMKMGSQSGQVLIGAESNHPAALQTNNTSRVIINSTGEVGVGVTPSTNIFEVRKDANDSSPRAKFSNNTNGTGAQAGLSVVSNDSSGVVIALPSGFTGVPAWADRFVVGAGGDATGLTFDAQAGGQDFRWFAGSATESMRLSSAGFLGVGTVAPRALFSTTNGTENTSGDVVNTAVIAGPAILPATTADGTLTLMSNSAQGAGVGPALTFGARRVTASTEGVDYASILGAKENATSNDLAGFMAFHVRGTGEGAVFERMRINSFGHEVWSGTAPTITADCGTSPSVVGNDVAGRITVGTGGTDTSCTLTFANSWGTAPVCSVNNETTTTLFAGWTPTTTTLVISSATPFTAGDKLAYRCSGF